MPSSSASWPRTALLDTGASRIDLPVFRTLRLDAQPAEAT
jgi:hypothetical protein